MLFCTKVEKAIKKLFVKDLGLNYLEECLLYNKLCDIFIKLSAPRAKGMFLVTSVVQYNSARNETVRRGSYRDALKHKLRIIDKLTDAGYDEDEYEVTISFILES